MGDTARKSEKVRQSEREGWEHRSAGKQKICWLVRFSAPPPTLFVRTECTAMRTEETSILFQSKREIYNYWYKHCKFMFLKRISKLNVIKSESPYLKRRLTWQGRTSRKTKKEQRYPNQFCLPIKNNFLNKCLTRGRLWNQSNYCIKGFWKIISQSFRQVALLVYSNNMQFCHHSLYIDFRVQN